MSELFIFLALIPLAFITLKWPLKIQKALCWMTVAIATVTLGYFLWLNQKNSLQWGPVLALFTLFIVDFIQEKKIAPFAALTGILVALATITSELGVIILLLAFADYFLELEIFSHGTLQEKNRAIRNVYRSLLSLLPVSFAVILQIQGESLTIAAAVTIALRVFSWPFPHWVNEAPSKLYYLLIAGASSFALWHAMDFSNQPEWSLIWLSAAGLFSLGAKETEIYIALTLGLFSLSPPLGLVGLALWPLLLNKGVVIYIVYLFVGLSGALIADVSSKIVLENVSYAITITGAILLARNLVGVKTKGRIWYKELIVFLLSTMTAGTFLYFIPFPQLSLGTEGCVFLGVFILSFILGKILLHRKPLFFEGLSPFKQRPSFLFFKSVELLKERSGPAPLFQPKTYLIRFFDALEGEGHMIWLLGLLGLAIWWGTK